MYKTFSKRDFKKYDVAARDAAKSFWTRQGWTVSDNPDEYGVDLIAEKDGKRVYVEVEVKACWHGTEFHYDTIHLPIRKTKFMDKPTKFMVFNNSLTHAAVIGRRAIEASPVSVVPNRKIAMGERFYDVPRDAAIFVYTME